jgi:hypothetical protein
MKAEIYKSLCLINESLQAAAEHLDKLKTSEVLTPAFADIRHSALEEIRADINQSAAIAIHNREADAAKHFEQERLDQEKRLRGES